MKAAIVHVRDPFRPQVNREIRPVSRRVRIDTLLRRQGLLVGRGHRRRRTTTFVVKSSRHDYLLESQWSRLVEDDETIIVINVPASGNALRAIALIVVAIFAWYAAPWVAGAMGVTSAAGISAVGAGLAIAGNLLVNAVMPLPKPPTGSNDASSTAYGIGAKGNTAKLLQPIPVVYGQFNVTPDYAAQPYTEFVGRDQTLYSLLAISQGEVQIDALRIGDTPMDNFSEVQYEVVPPGGTVTLFPDNVVSSDAVQGLELKAPSDGGDWMGPFTANPAGTKASQLAVDLGYASGLYRVNDDGKLKTANSPWEVQYQLIDDTGTAIGAWATLAASNDWLSDKTAGIFTSHSVAVPPGRYQVRARKLQPAAMDGTVINTLSWLGLRAYLPSQRVYGDVTLLAVRIKATNNLNSSTAKAINVTCTRKLPVWNGASWSAPVATKNPAWAIADVLRNTTYGRGWPDNRMDLPALLELADTWATRGDEFNGVFDTKTSLWDALQSVCRVGRSIPMYYAGVVEVIRDAPRSVPILSVTPQNMLAGSFSIQYAFPTYDNPDYVVVTYTDPTTWESQTVDCALTGSEKLNPKAITLMGCTSRDQAFREGMYMAACNRDQRKMVSVTTEMEGYIPRYGDLVTVTHDVPAWGISGFIEAYDEVSGTLVTSEPAQWFVGQNHVVSLRQRNGAPLGPFTVIKGADDFHLVLQGLTPEQKAAIYISDGTSEEPTIYQFGPAGKEAQQCLVLKAKPDGKGNVQLGLVNYALSVHLAENDANTPPPGSGSLLNDQPQAPAVGGVGVHQDDGTQIVRLHVDPVPGAVAYEFQVSYDGGVTWISVGISPSNSITTSIPAGDWIVRARAMGSLGIPGPWNQTPISVSGAPPVLGAVANLTASSMLMAILLTWQLPNRDKLIGAEAVEIWFNTTTNRATASLLATLAIPTNTYTLSNLKAGVTLYFWARVRGTDTGNYSPEVGPVVGTSSSDAAQLLDYLTGQIGRDQLTQDLLTPIDAAAGLVDFITTPDYDPAVAYAQGDIVGDAGRLWRAVQAVPAGGAAPGTDPAFWEDVGSLNITADGLAASISDVNLQVDQLGDEVQATATKTDGLYVQLNPKSAGELDDPEDGSAGDWTSMDYAGFYSYTIAQVKGDMALSQRIDTFSVRVDAVQASVTDETTARVAGDAALASRVTTVESVAGTASSQAQLAINTAASVDGKVSSSIALKTSVAVGGQTYLAGLMVGVDGAGGTVTSQVLVNAGTFAVFDASNGSLPPRIPFVITGGQVIIDQAFIGDGTITNAKIGDTIQSTNYVAGVSGWKLSKSGDSFELNGTAGGGHLLLTPNLIQLKYPNGNILFRAGTW
jgi:predicted phage tail protein